MNRKLFGISDLAQKLFVDENEHVRSSIKLLKKTTRK